MSKYYVTDIRHYPPPGAPVDIPAAARRLRDYLGRIIEAASPAPSESVVLTSIVCRHSSKQRPCLGRLRALRDGETGEIHWRCMSCGEGGMISNWRGTVWDRSGEPVSEPDGRLEEEREGFDVAPPGDGRGGPGRGPADAILREALELLGREPESLEELQSAVGAASEAYNRRPQEELGGLSPLQVQRLLSSDWAAPGGALSLDEGLPLETLAGARTLLNAREFLRALRDAGGTRATAAGNLNRKFVAAMVEEMTWPAGFSEGLYEYNKVVNEEDAFPLHVVRLLLDLAGLIKRRKGAFSVTRRGEKLLDETRAGELFARLFRVQFRKMNLGYLDRAPEVPGFQQTVAYSFYHFGRAGVAWSKPAALAPAVILPAVQEQIPRAEYVDYGGLILETRLLRPLERFGLVESREVPGRLPRFPGHEYRKTPLYDRFLLFRLDAPPAG